ncbi:asparagine synthase-domain-containing protein [Irpex rosettiformis]|uniref:Asparagine synthase-domain-containing protein n=1 Tax=Irpex rosettiformis TaxID=378272 RepID=A0ACB8ULU2_9APHY|nr:asparagine synthase-domain-containing protein [Irpex rosettiformis]
MCGILFTCKPIYEKKDHHNPSFDSAYERLKAANAARGPDAQDTVQVSLGQMTLSFFGSELRLRGYQNVSQPHRDDQGNIMCWNGEIFEGLEVAPEENDGVKLFDTLRNLETVQDVRTALGKIEGPYAIVFYHAKTRKLLFARDPLGRRSLLVHKPTQEHPYLILASVSAGTDPLYAFDELSTIGFFVLDIERLGLGDIISAWESTSLLPRAPVGERYHFAGLSKINANLPNDPPMVSDIDHIPEHLCASVDQLVAHLEDSVRLQVCNIPIVHGELGQARIAVLFSGGIDSTIIAYLASLHADPNEPIDLLNVAFENPRKILVQEEGNLYALQKRERKQKMKARLDYSTITVKYDVPDRVTGRQELEELRRLCPDRTWNFVEINVPFEEYEAARPIIEALMLPGRTVMDLSLAAALYFAARGIGEVRRSMDAEPLPYTSPARVLLNGLGSDELLGGYGRFRTAYKAKGWEAIIDELQLELDRIPTRNLGRDDRVISSHGKETRHPFLSLSVVSFLARLPVHMKLDPRLETGLGEKMLLRLAANKVGLCEAAKRKKRAMQFGSHSARMAPGDEDRKGDRILPVA